MTFDISHQNSIAARLINLWPPVLAAIILLIVVVQALLLSLDLNGGQFVYGLDDAYIHMAIAKNFVRHGVWGMTEFGYTSTSSSPLWTFLVAVSYVVVGVNQYTPYLMNIALGVGVIFAVNHVLKRHRVPAGYRFGVLVALIILLPLNTLILSGMEHVLQILVAVLFIHFASEAVCADETPPLRSVAFLRLILLGVSVGSTRYEGLFLVAIFCGFFALRLRGRLFVAGLILGGVSVAPIVVYGLIALDNGWDFLPASLILKSDANYLAGAPLDAWITYFIEDTFNILANQHVMSLLLLSALALYLVRYDRERRFWSAVGVMLLALVAITAINIRLVSWPWAGTFSRYEAYLVALGLVVLPASIGVWLPRRPSRKAAPVYAVAGLLLLFVLNDIYTRYERIAFETPVVTATNDIYSQQYQMAHFLERYYTEAVVAANDIGAINYFAAIDNVDLWGLGTVEVTHAVRDNAYTTDTIRRITSERGVEIALVYDTWFDPYGGLPDAWVKVGEWRLTRDPAILGHHTVSFYAVMAGQADALAANLRDYTASLPAGVVSEVIER